MQAELKELRILHTASQVLFYLMTFRTEDFQRTMCDSGMQRKEELLQVLCDVLTQRGEDYNALTDYLEDEANGAYSLFGIRSTEFVSREQYAANLVIEIELLNRPIRIDRPSSGPPEDF